MEALGLIIGLIWKLLCIPFRISPTITFTLWQYFSFIIVLAVLCNAIFKKSGGEEK